MFLPSVTWQWTARPRIKESKAPIVRPKRQCFLQPQAEKAPDGTTTRSVRHAHRESHGEQRRLFSPTMSSAPREIPGSSSAPRINSPPPPGPASGSSRSETPKSKSNRVAHTLNACVRCRQVRVLPRISDGPGICRRTPVSQMASLYLLIPAKLTCVPCSSVK